MKSLELVPADEVEYVQCENVKPEDIKEILEIYVPQMEGILEAKHGLGLAAPQVGIKKKFFVAQDVNKKGKYDVFFNVLYTGDGSKIKVTEGCLTYPGQEVEMRRYKAIRLIHEVWNGKELKREITRIKGAQAVVYQHETDHCGNGPNRLGQTIFTR